MYLVSDVILKIRSRTQDKKAEKWSDEELIDAINSSYIKLATDLLLFTDIKIITTIQDKFRYEMPYGMVRAMSYKLDGIQAVIKSFEWVSSHEEELEDYDLIVYQDEKSFFIYPENIKSDQKIKLTYNYTETIASEDDELKIPMYAQNALLFYTMHLVHQVGNVSTKQVDKSMQYLGLYHQELISVKSTIARNKHSRNLKSKFQKV
jgi:hypothetical protein